MLIGGQSGFKTARDLILFIFGLALCGFHVLTTPPADLSIPLLMFGGGLAGAPYVIRKDEKRQDEKSSPVGE